MKFLVVGCGSIGKRHIQNLLELGAGEIVACDTRPDRLEEVRGRFNVSVSSDFEHAVNQELDAVLVCTPTSMHIPFAHSAVERGLHVFIEKPLSHSMDGVDRFVTEVNKQKSVVLVGCNFRFHPGLAKMKHLLENRTVGSIISVRAQTGQWLPDWHPWEDYRQGYSANRSLGGGIILDSVHEIDYAQWLVGSLINNVACFADHLSPLEIDTEDTAALLVGFANSAIGEIHMDYVQRSYVRSCQIIGDEGTVHWDYSSQRVSWYSATTQKWEEFIHTSTWDPNDMYLDELRHFILCLSGEEQPAQDANAARQILGIALAAKQSAKCGKVIEKGAL